MPQICPVPFCDGSPPGEYGPFPSAIGPPLVNMPRYLLRLVPPGECAPFPSAIAPPLGEYSPFLSAIGPPL
eukprot:7568788-Pyramimonas_sp.AAC.1